MSAKAPEWLFDEFLGVSVSIGGATESLPIRDRGTVSLRTVGTIRKCRA